MENMTLAKMETEIQNILKVDSIEEMMKWMKKIELMEEALKIADMFNQQSVEFAKLEAGAIVRLVELGGEKKLKGDRKQAAKWLATLEPEVREIYIMKCEDGLSITQVWKREIGEPGNKRYFAEEMKRCENEIIDKIGKDGIVRISDYDSKIYLYTKEFGTDVKDGIRSRLRKMGAVGINDERGTYVMPSNPNFLDEVVEAVRERIKGIKKDLISLNKIAKEANIKINPADVVRGNTRFAFSEPYGSAYIMMALSDVGVTDRQETLKFLNECQIDESDEKFANYVDDFRSMFANVDVEESVKQ